MKRALAAAVSAVILIGMSASANARYVGGYGYGPYGAGYGRGYYGGYGHGYYGGYGRGYAYGYGRGYGYRFGFLPPPGYLAPRVYYPPPPVIYAPPPGYYPGYR